MVSKARLDFPEPDSPVMTTRLSRGISSEMFLRLCTRAPCTATVVRAATFGGFLPVRLAVVLEGIWWLPRIEKCELVGVDVALLRKVYGRRGFADEPLVRQ